MKSNKIYILASILFCLCLQAKGQSAGNLNNTFVNKNPSEENLQAFEFRAEQKLEDFVDYIEIISNKKYDTTMRKQAASSALKLFVKPEAEIKESIIKEKSWKVNEYLNALSSSTYQRVVGKILNHGLTKELQKEKDNTYKGEISFTQNLKAYNKKDEVVFEKTSEKKAEIILKKVKKQFGEKTEEVWEVLIGKIY